MDLQDQLKQLFLIIKQISPQIIWSSSNDLWLQDDPSLQIRKRKGKPITIIEGYDDANDDFKQLSTLLRMWCWWNI